MWVDDREDDIVYAIRKLIQVGMPRRAVGLAGRMRKSNLRSDLVMEVLREAARQPLAETAEHNDLAMFRHHVAELMQLLDARDDVDRDVLATLEWSYLEVLEHSRRPAKTLLAELSEQPKLFVDLLKVVYRKSDEDSAGDDPAIETQKSRKQSQTELINCSVKGTEFLEHRKMAQSIR